MIIKKLMNKFNCVSFLNYDYIPSGESILTIHDLIPVEVQEISKPLNKHKKIGIYEYFKLIVMSELALFDNGFTRLKFIIKDNDTYLKNIIVKYNLLPNCKKK